MENVRSWAEYKIWELKTHTTVKSSMFVGAQILADYMVKQRDEFKYLWTQLWINLLHVYRGESHKVISAVQ